MIVMMTTTTAAAAAGAPTTTGLRVPADGEEIAPRVVYEVGPDRDPHVADVVVVADDGLRPTDQMTDGSLQIYGERILQISCELT